MRTPSAYQFVLLTLAAYRCWRLVAIDDVTWKLRAWLVDWQDFEGVPARLDVAEFIHCPWCLGWWIVLAGWIAYEVWPHTVPILAVPLAASALVGMMRRSLDP